VDRDGARRAGAAAAVAAAGAAGAAVAARKLTGGERRTYRLDRDEPLPDELRRVARGRVDHALDELRGDTDSSPEEAVHEARKDMKKLRALLRLARAELGDYVFRFENATARDTARLLAGARDATVMLETLEGLPVRHPQLRSALERHAAAAGEPRRDEAIAALGGIGERIGEWPLERDDFAAVKPGLRRIYRQGRRAMRKAEADPTVENLHEWRKREKDLWYHLRLLRDVRPKSMRAAADEADALADHLGDDHDLAVLLEFARERGFAEQIEDAVDERRAALQAQAFEAGGRLYAERPKDFARRLRNWWEGG
jgi:CHAD domain-containing protein